MHDDAIALESASLVPKTGRTGSLGTRLGECLTGVLKQLIKQLTVSRPVHAHTCFCWRFWKQIPARPYTLPTYPCFWKQLTGRGIVRSQGPPSVPSLAVCSQLGYLPHTVTSSHIPPHTLTPSHHTLTHHLTHNSHPHHHLRPSHPHTHTLTHTPHTLTPSPSHTQLAPSSPLHTLTPSHTTSVQYSKLQYVCMRGEPGNETRCGSEDLCLTNLLGHMIVTVNERD